jgi:hypothetical protein
MTITFTSQLRYAFIYLSIFTLFASCSKNSSPAPVHVKQWNVTTLAGSSTPGFTDGDTTHVQFNNLQAITTDYNGNLYVGDIGNAAVRQVTYAGHVTTYAGNSVGSPNPPFGNIYGLVRDNQGNLYTSESFAVIRKIVSGTSSSIFAGSGTLQYVDGTGTNAAFNYAANMAIDAQNNIFLPDYDNNGGFLLRKITPAGVVSTITLQDNTGISSNAQGNLHYLYCITLDASGNIYVTSNGNCLIKKISPAGVVTVLAGSVNPGFKDGAGTAAQFYGIAGLACDASGNLWVSDSNNQSIREVTPDGTVTTIAGNGGPGYMDAKGSAALFKYPSGIVVDNTGVLYVTDNGNNRVRRLEYK